LQAMERVLADAICECAFGQQPGRPIVDVLSANARRTCGGKSRGRLINRGARCA
jgi:hypothetical protein